MQLLQAGKMGSGRTGWIHMLTKWCHIMSHLLTSGHTNTAIWFYTRAQLNVGQISFMPHAINFGDRLSWIYLHMPEKLYIIPSWCLSRIWGSKLTICPLDFGSWPCHHQIPNYRLTIIVRMVWALTLNVAGIFHPQYTVKVELGHGNASIHKKDQQNQTQNNIQ